MASECMVPRCVFASSAYKRTGQAADTTCTRRICHLETLTRLARLNAKSNKVSLQSHLMTFHLNAAPLRTLRMRSGLSQREVAEILGFKTDVPAFRHEYAKTLPDLRTALGYEILFRVPISMQFQGLYRAIEPLIEDRISELKRRLEAQAGRGENAARNAAKLEFLWLRQNTDCD